MDESAESEVFAHRRLLDWKTVQQHNTPDDCWVVIKGKVYDVSGWGLEHPGGAVVYTYGGKVRGCGWTPCSGPQSTDAKRTFLTRDDRVCVWTLRTRRTCSPPSTRLRRGCHCVVV